MAQDKVQIVFSSTAIKLSVSTRIASAQASLRGSGSIRFKDKVHYIWPIGPLLKKMELVVKKMTATTAWTILKLRFCKAQI
jgi:hypothetical protein